MSELKIQIKFIISLAHFKEFFANFKCPGPNLEN